MAGGRWREVGVGRKIGQEARLGRIINTLKGYLEIIGLTTSFYRCR